MLATAMTDVVDVLRTLIAFDTTSHRSNRALIAFVADILRRHGVEAQLVENEDGTKANLLATLGPATAGGVVLSGHTDVVPVTGQDWSSDPFALRDAEDRFYGRGTADMKGFIAVALAMSSRFLSCPLRVPIHLALSYDEEVGCLGAPALIARLVDAVPRPALAIIGEPSEMMVANAHRGINTFVTAVRGRPAHGSAPHLGVNAISYAAECITHLDRINPTVAAADADPGPGNDSAAAGATTVNIGTIDGGAAVNIIAEHCRFAWECRPAPGHSAETVRGELDAFATDALLPRMRAHVPEASIETTPGVAVPPLAPEPGSAAEQLALRMAQQNRCGAIPFASEAGLFQRAGIPAVVCGPGSWAEAHQPDEFVSRQQLAACVGFMERLAQWATDPS